MNECRYSPLPIENYFIDIPVMSSIKAISKLDLAPAVWNLMWLSHPQVDNLPGAGDNWHKVYTTPEDLQKALIRDVYDDEVLYRKLCMTPIAFLDWWRREDHTIYDAYDVGGKDWVETVTSRAEEAAARLSKVIEVRDNVIAVKFGRAA